MQSDIKGIRRTNEALKYRDINLTLVRPRDGAAPLLVMKVRIVLDKMASPSSTAAYLMHTTTWDNEAEDYQRHVISEGEGRGGGGVPSALPSTHF